MRPGFAILILAVLAGCADLPHDGPSGKSVADTAAKPGRPYALVDLDYRRAQLVAETPPRPFASLSSASSSAPVDLIGPGDALAVSVWEAGGATLFASAGAAGSTAGAGAGSLPRVVVDRDGAVTLPFAGTVRVAGLTPSGAGVAVKAALRGKAVNPQVLVSVSENMANSVTVLGEVRNSGRYPIGGGSDRLLDVIASAGGVTRSAGDVQVTVVRGAAVASTPLSVLMRESGENIRLAPRDQVRLVYKPRKFSSFGAVGHAAQFALEDDNVTLASAISRAGGLDNGSADSSSVLVFRFERPEVAAALGLDVPATPKGVPVVYRLNLRDPAGYFVAGQFGIEPEDLLYVPRAGVAEAKKFFEIVTIASQVAYNVRVTSVLK